MNSSNFMTFDVLVYHITYHNDILLYSMYITSVTLWLGNFKNSWNCCNAKSATVTLTLSPHEKRINYFYIGKYYFKVILENL